MSSNPPPELHSQNLKELAHETVDRINDVVDSATGAQLEAIVLDSLRLVRNLTPDPDND